MNYNFAAGDRLPDNWATNHKWGDIVINNELQLYRPANIQYRADALYLVGNKSADDNQWYSGLVGSNDTDDIVKHDSPWVVEAEIKLPESTGLLPAFWLRPTERREGEDPVLVEIDMMEAPHGNSDFKAGIHTRMGADDMTVLQNLRKIMCPATDLTQTWNQYTCRYTMEYYEFFINGVLFHHVKVPRDHKKRDWYVILNLAIGGNYPGNPPANVDRVEMGIRSLNIEQMQQPNRDVIKRLDKLRNDSIQCINQRTQTQIDELLL